MIIKNEYLREWIDENYPLMKDDENCLIELDYYDMDKFSEWLVNKLSIGVVSGSLLEIELIDWDHTCGDGCCYIYGQDITLNGEKLDEQNAEDSKNALTAVLTKLGYNVDINYR